MGIRPFGELRRAPIHFSVQIIAYSGLMSILIRLIVHFFLIYFDFSSEGATAARINAGWHRRSLLGAQVGIAVGCRF